MIMAETKPRKQVVKLPYIGISLPFIKPNFIPPKTRVCAIIKIKNLYELNRFKKSKKSIIIKFPTLIRTLINDQSEISSFHPKLPLCESTSAHFRWK